MAGYIGSKASVVSSGVERKKTYSITGSTTSLTGLNYTVGKVHVYQNGVRLLDGTDYTATNGTSITLTVAAQSGDNVVVISQASFQLSESYTSTEADAEFVTKTGDTMTGDLSFGDNDKAKFGVGNDLQVYHDGSNSYIDDAGTGNLYLRASNAIIMQSSDGAETIASFHDDNLCRLYYDNSIKLATTATGIDVTGSSATDTGILVTNSRNGVGMTLRLDNTNNGPGKGSGIKWQSGGFETGTIITRSVGTAASGDAPGYMTFHTSNDGSEDLAERMRIDSSGNVGIGTTSPTNGKLEVTHSSSTIPAGFFRNTSGSGDSPALTVQGGAHNTAPNFSVLDYNGNTDFVVQGAGKVGIGRTDPSQLLEVHKNAGGNQTAAKFSAHNYGDTGKTYIELGTEYGDGSSRIGSFNTSGNKSALVFEVHANTSGSFSEKMRIDDLGRVTTPYQPGVCAIPSIDGNNSIASGDQTHLPFARTLFNNGNHYNTSNSIFTAPVAGYYFTSAQARWETGTFVMSSYIRLFISLNNGSYNTTRIHAINGNNEAFSNYMAMSCSGIVYCSAGDTLRPKGGHNGGTSNLHGESSFHVYLLG